MAVRPSKSKEDKNYAGCGIAALILFVILAVSQCNEKPKTAEQDAATAFSNVTGSAIAEQVHVPIEPVNRDSVKQALREFKVVSAVEGLSGDMIYSQNCFEALTHKFDWDRVDLCAAFDLLAVARVSETSEVSSSETAYFESETAAGRYLAAVTGAGEEAEKADTRLEALQRLVGKNSPVVPASEDPQNANIPEPAWDSDSEGAENQAEI